MFNEEEFLLKWNNHQNNLISVFKDWLKDESFVDITLVCGGEAVSGHKVILAACSPLLNRILHDNPCRHPVVILNDVCSTDMRALLKFIYHGEVSVSQAELASFLKTAHNLQIKGLSEDREKEEKKRKNKDEGLLEIMKKRKPDIRLQSSSHEQSRIYKGKEVVASSPKSDAKYVNNNSNNINNNSNNNNNNKDVISSLNSHNQLTSSSGSAYVNSHQLLTTNNLNSTPILEQEYDISLQDPNVQPEIMVVKSEPLEYGGEIVWQEDSSHFKNENTEQEDSITMISNASSGFAYNQQQTHSTSLPFEVVQSSVDEGFSSSSTADSLQKNLELTLSGEEKKSDDDKNLPLGTEELNQSNFLTAYEESVDEDALALGSPGKFRGERKPCCFCGKTFCDNYTLRRHMVTHLSRQRQFECSQCNAAYSRKDHLMAHVRRKHPIGDYEIEATIRPS